MVNICIISYLISTLIIKWYVGIRKERREVAVKRNSGRPRISSEDAGRGREKSTINPKTTPQHVASSRTCDGRQRFGEYELLILKILYSVIFTEVIFYVISEEKVLSGILQKTNLGKWLSKERQFLGVVTNCTFVF